MGKETTKTILICQAIAKTDMPFGMAEGKAFVYAEPKDMSLLLSRLAEFVSGFKLVVKENEKYFLLDDGRKIYIIPRDEFKNPDKITYD